MATAASCRSIPPRRATPSACRGASPGAAAGRPTGAEPTGCTAGTSMPPSTAARATLSRGVSAPGLACAPAGVINAIASREAHACRLDVSGLPAHRSTFRPRCSLSGRWEDRRPLVERRCSPVRIWWTHSEVVTSGGVGVRFRPSSKRGVDGVSRPRSAGDRAAGPHAGARAGKQRALLAVLLVHANEVVSTDRLIDALWGERHPQRRRRSSRGTSHGFARCSKTSSTAQVRSGSGRGGSILLTRSPGYVLRIEDGQLDAHRFTALLAKARAALAAGAALEASTLLREALGLWRGPPLSDFAFDSFAQDEIARLDELHLAALEELVDADLALGRQGDLVADLEVLVARHPLRERLRGQLMIALYRCGRQAEALQVYQDARRVLVDELGLEPSREIVELEQAILRQDPALDRPPARGNQALGGANRRRLPSEPFAGRGLRRAGARARNAPRRARERPVRPRTAPGRRR